MVFLKRICAAVLLISLSSLAQDRVTARGPHTDVHEKVREELRGNETVSITNRYTVLQSGLNRFSESENAWVPSESTIEVAEVGARYRKGPFKLDFALNHNDPAGAVTLTLTDGRVVIIQTVGIALTSSTGDSVWIGEAQDANGVLDGNVVAYQNAFSGTKADVVVRVGTGKYESDVVLREQIITPQSLGWDPAETRLEIWHTIKQLPAVHSQFGHINRKNGTVDLDEQLFFRDTNGLSDIFIGEGTAFLTITTNAQVALPNQAGVAKERFNDTAAQIQYLIESIPYSEIISNLQTLPARQQASIDRDRIRRVLDQKRQVALVDGSARATGAPGISETGSGTSRTESNERSTPEVRRRSRLFTPATLFDYEPSWRSERAPMKEGKANKSNGLVIDYTVLVGASNFRLESGTTYYVTGTVHLTGTTTIEGGTVVKFSPYNSSTLSPVIYADGPVNCLTTNYLPAIFTAYSDNSVGEVINTNGISGWYAWHNFIVSSGNPNAMDLHDLSMRFGSTGLTLFGTNTHHVSNIQVMGSYYGLSANNNTTYVHNYLSYSNMVPLFAHNSTYRAEHVTAHTSSRLFSIDPGSIGSAFITNSLVVGMTNTSTGVTTDHVTTLASDSGVFQTVAAGGHYLSETSTNRNAGITVSALSTNMARILAKTTTAPPTILSNTVSIDTTLWPGPQRDTDTPDLGYHYYPLDYIANCVVVTNATLSLTNGVATGLLFGYGFYLDDGSHFYSSGTAERPNYLVEYGFCQEQPIRVIQATGYPYASYTMVGHAAGTATATASTRFTEFIGPNPRYHIYMTKLASLDCSHCIFHAGTVMLNDATGVPTGGFTNNLFERVNNLMIAVESPFYFYNNLFWHTTNYISSLDSTIFFYDNAFDSAVFTHCDPVYSTNNAFVNGSGRLNPTTTNDIVLTSFTYAEGPLGRYYHAITNLVDRGSRNATNATLYHFTTQSTLAKETNSVVDVGFHYVATDAAGVPMDTDGDGMPDYIEDRNGNGAADAGETSWLSSNGAATSPAALIIFTPLQ